MERLKTKSASIKDGVLLIDQGGEELPADDVALLCEAEADSSGYVVIGENFAFYIVNTQPDLAAIITKITEVCDQIEALSLQMVSRTPDQTPLDPLVTTEIGLIRQALLDFELK